MRCHVAGLMQSPFRCRRLDRGCLTAWRTCAGNQCPRHKDRLCQRPRGITLPPGFCATVFADKLGHPRHLVVAPDGVVYVNTWSGRYYQNDTPPPGGFLIALKDTKGNGQCRRQYPLRRDRRGWRSTGGTGIALSRTGSMPR